jgi:hypothetical protein
MRRMNWMFVVILLLLSYAAFYNTFVMSTLPIG